MKTWDIKKTQYRVSDFLSWQRSKSLILSPSFQRRPVWQKGAKSYLMDTVIRGLPIPIIFLREQKSDLKTLEPKREIVDGQQRIRTILSYIDHTLLTDYSVERDEFEIKDTHNKALSGKKFNMLDQDIKQRILDYEFSVHVLPSQVEDSEVLEIFARMNATGVKLNEQELRNAKYFGYFKTLSYRLASEQLQRWRSWKVFSEHNIARMDEVELTSEFLILIIKGLSARDHKLIDRYYKDYEIEFNDKNEVEKRFNGVMDAIDDILGKEMPNIAFNKKTLVYNLFAVFYDKQYTIGSSLKKKKPKPISSVVAKALIILGKKILNKTAPASVLQACSRRTTHLNSRGVVFNYLKQAM